MTREVDTFTILKKKPRPIDTAILSGFQAVGIVREMGARIYISLLNNEQVGALVEPEGIEGSELIGDYSKLVGTLNRAPIYQSSLNTGGVSTSLVVLLILNGYTVQYSLQPNGNVPMVQVVTI